MRRWRPTRKPLPCLLSSIMTQQHFWLDIEAAITIHEMQIALHGGTSGIRDYALLHLALERPKMALYYAKHPLPVLAAYYAIGITHNHPFFDGNKRVTLGLCDTFLRYHEQMLSTTTQETYEAIINLSSGVLSDEAFIEWVQKHTHPIR